MPLAFHSARDDRATWFVNCYPECDISLAYCQYIVVSCVLSILGLPASLHLVPPLTGKGSWCCDFVRAVFRQKLGKLHGFAATEGQLKSETDSQGGCWSLIRKFFDPRCVGAFCIGNAL